MRNLLHRLFGAHRPDPAQDHWAQGRHASICIDCGRAMVRLPGLPWRADGSS